MLKYNWCIGDFSSQTTSIIFEQVRLRFSYKIFKLKTESFFFLLLLCFLLLIDRERRKTPVIAMTWRLEAIRKNRVSAVTNILTVVDKRPINRVNALANTVRYCYDRIYEENCVWQKTTRKDYIGTNIIPFTVTDLIRKSTFDVARNIYCPMRPTSDLFGLTSIVFMGRGVHFDLFAFLWIFTE